MPLSDELSAAPPVDDVTTSARLAADQATLAALVRVLVGHAYVAHSLWSCQRIDFGRAGGFALATFPPDSIEGSDAGFAAEHLDQLPLLPREAVGALQGVRPGKLHIEHATPDRVLLNLKFPDDVLPKDRRAVLDLVELVDGPRDVLALNGRTGRLLAHAFCAVSLNCREHSPTGSSWPSTCSSQSLVGS